MFELKQDKLTETRQGYLFTYVQIIFNQCRRFGVLEGDQPEYEGWMKYTQEFQINAERLETRILAVITTALFLEAYIYDYGARKHSANFVEKYLDKLDPFAKWVIIPRLISPPGLDQNDEVFARLKKLFTLRNALVHHKTKSGGDFAAPPDFPDDLEPYHCVQLAQDVLTKLYQLDSTDEFAAFVLRHLNSWIEYCSKDDRFYPILWEA